MARFSIFTPTHNLQHLARLAHSIRKQTFSDWEWIIVPNGGASLDGISLPEQARVVEYTGKTQNIGELKHFACSAAVGQILVEVDHDDELTPDCLAELHRAFTEGCDFAYTNCVEVRADGKPHKYGAQYGWRYRPWMLGLEECVAFDPTPASFSRIWFAPNHVRAWRRSFYESIGGHDRRLDVLDDHDLMARTYIAGTVAHIDKPLYVYHVHSDNTCYSAEKNAKIQTGTLVLHDKYIYPMVEKWCDLQGLRKIDLCGGHDSPTGYESVDLRNGSITTNLNEPWTWAADGSVGLIRAHDALEHLRDPQHTMREAYRVLVPGGWLLSRTPSTDGRGAWQDPTHCSYWNSNSFWYYTRQDQNRYIDCPVRFQATRVRDFFPSPWHELHQIVYTDAHLMRLGWDRVPGLVEI